MKPITMPVEIELREAEGGPRLHGTIVQEGRASTGGRAELFAPGAVTWPETGIEIRATHLGRPEVRAMPRRAANGEITIEAAATPALVEAVKAGKTSMSVEFYPLRETRTAGGIRELQRVLVDAAALTNDPEYAQARVELRNRRRRRVWL